MSGVVARWRGEPRPRRGPEPPRWERDGGPMSLAGLDGSFSVEVEVEGERWVATDRYASRPVFLAADSTRSWSAAEDLRSLVARKEAFDPVAFSQWLCFGYIPLERTLFQGVRRLGPGSWFSLRTGERRRYWRWAGGTSEAMPSGLAPTSMIDALEQAAVEVAAIEERNVVLLSGGIDSRAIFLRLKSLGRPVEALSFGAEGDLDVVRARELCRAHDVRHSFIEVTHEASLGGMTEWSRVVSDLTDNAFVTLPMGPAGLTALEGASLWLGTDSFSTVLPAQDPVEQEGYMGLLRGAVASRAISPDVFAHAGLASSEGLGAIELGFEEVLSFLREEYAEASSWDVAFDRISHETRFRVWNVNRWLFEQVSRRVITPFHDVDLVEAYAALPVPLRAQRHAHLAANRERFPHFDAVPLHQRTSAEAHFRRVREDPALQAELREAIEAVSEARTMLEPMLRGLEGGIEDAHPLLLGLFLRAGVACRHFLVMTEPRSAR